MKRSHKVLSWGFMLYSFAQEHSGAKAQANNHQYLAEELHCPSKYVADYHHDYEYDWEGWDYYQLLGLERPTTQSSTNDSSLDPKVIRKAYRKQAQKWHPDKHTASSSSTESTAKHNSTTTSRRTAKKTTPPLSLEEATARFARIAQAYEVLSDDWKRQEYDSFLQYCETISSLDTDSPTAAPSSRTRWSKLFSNFGDPLRVFEDFLFGNILEEDAASTIDYMDEEDEEDSWFFDMPPRNSDPIRITKHQDLIRNAFGEEMVRISQTEEYSPEADGRYFYRILSQDFAQYLDPYTGRITLQPLTQPYLREEGMQTPPKTGGSSKSSRSKSTQAQELPRESLLFPGDVLTPNSALLVSPNRRYYAGLSADCELLIMVDNTFGEDKVIWSSERLTPNTNNGYSTSSSNACFATLRGPHLVVATGRPELPNRILWYSEAEDELEEGDNPNYGMFQAPHAASTYLAQLDNDGSLSIYKVWAPPTANTNLPLSTRAWMATRNLLIGNTRDHNYDHIFDNRNNPFARSAPSRALTTYKRCIYATGPLGCFRLARRFYQLSLDIYYSIKSLAGKLDSTMDVWMDLILEEDDYLRVLKESTVGFGSQIVTSSARIVRRILHVILLKNSS